MNETTTLITNLLALGTLGGLVWLVWSVGVLGVVMAKEKKHVTVPSWMSAYLGFFERFALLFSFLIATAGMILSLYYSEGAGFEPCRLCWYQRIFLYPLVFLFGTALLRKDRIIWPYALVLTVIGAALALDHQLLQMGVVSTSICAIGTEATACAQRFFVSYGFITIPMMSLSAFLFIAFFMALLWRSARSR